MDSGEEDDDDDDDEKRRRGPVLRAGGRAGGLKERMGKENPSGRYILHTYLPTLGR